MLRTRLLPAAALAAGLLCAATAGAQPVVRPAGSPPPVRDPLPVVPASAGAFVTLKVSDLANHPDLKPAFAQLAKQPDALAGLVGAVGVAPTDIDRVTLFWPRLGRGGADPVLVLTTVEPFNEARVLKGLRATAVFDGDPRHFGGPGAAPKVGVKQAPPMLKTEGFPPPAPPPFEPKAFPPPVGEPKNFPPPAPPPGVKEGADASAREAASGEAFALCAARVPADIPDPLFYALEGGPFGALFLVDERTLVFLPGRGDGEFAAMALLASTLKKDRTGPLADALAAAAGHTFAAGIDLGPLLRNFDARRDRELAPYAALFGTRTAVVTGDLTRTAKLTLTLTFDDATAARRAAPVLEEGIAAIGAKADEAVAEFRDSRRPLDRAAAPVLGALVAGLKKAAVRADGAAVRAVAEVDVGPAAAKALADVIAAAEARRKAALRTNNLKQIGLALHGYHDVNGRFPTNVYGPDGKALLSWRVHLLPFLEEAALYQQFKLDEPWDGPNNKKLVEKMPKALLAPDRKHAPGETYYQAFVERERVVPLRKWSGRPWLKDGEKAGLGFGAIYDGSSNTLAVVEARDGVVWTRPDDLPFGGAVPHLGEPGSEAAPALRFDGSVSLFPNGLKPAEFWPFVTINGGEVTPDPEDYLGGPRGAGAGAAPPAAAPLPAREPEPAPLPAPPKAEPGARDRDLRAKLDTARATVAVADAQVEASAALVERLGRAGAAADDVARAKEELAAQLVRRDALRREVAELEAQMKSRK